MKFGIKEICVNDLLTRINTLELYLCMINSAQARNYEPGHRYENCRPANRGKCPSALGNPQKKENCGPTIKALTLQPPPPNLEVILFSDFFFELQSKFFFPSGPPLSGPITKFLVLFFSASLTKHHIYLTLLPLPNI